MTEPGLLALGLLALVCSSERVAYADPASDEAAAEERRTAAKSKYQQGADAYTAGRYKDAVDLFLSADRLAPSAPLSFNIARAYEKLGDDSGALRWYRDYLRRNPRASNAESVRTLIAGLAQALAKKGVQQLSVLSSPAGATVLIDDQPVGVTPWTGELSPGKHHVLLTARGYADIQRDFELSPSEPLDLTLRMEQSSAAIESPPVAPSQPPSTSPPSGREGSSRGVRLGVWPWVTLGAGGAALGGALTFELLRRGAEHDAKADPTQLGYQDRLESEQSRQALARVFLGVGGGLLVAGGVMLLLDPPGAAQRTSAGLVCLPSGCVVAARGGF